MLLFFFFWLVVFVLLLFLLLPFLLFDTYADGNTTRQLLLLISFFISFIRIFINNKALCSHLCLLLKRCRWLRSLLRTNSTCSCYSPFFSNYKSCCRRNVRLSIRLRLHLRLRQRCRCCFIAIFHLQLIMFIIGVHDSTFPWYKKNSFIILIYSFTTRCRIHHYCFFFHYSRILMIVVVVVNWLINQRGSPVVLLLLFHFIDICS